MGLFDFFSSSKKIKPKIKKEGSLDDLSDPHQIKFHIEEIIAEKSIVGLMLDDDPEEYSTTFFSILEDEPQGILMDTVIPNEGNEFIKNSKKMSFLYVFKGKHFSFETKFLGMIEEEFTTVKIALPKEIKKVEHRESVRIKPSLNELIHVYSKIEDPSGEMEEIQEEVVDVSSGGLAFYTERDIFEDEFFEKIAFNLPPENFKIHCNAIVLRFIERAAPSRKDKNICCIEFSEMKDSHRDMLVKYIYSRERQIIQERLRV